MRSCTFRFPIGRNQNCQNVVQAEPAPTNLILIKLLKSAQFAAAGLSAAE